ncbi:DUF3626 domain-containing protein [Actinoplanes sp. NPDC051861]|uniref:DUF3626 domain-containing protein n=1 Tax=Actinoplanes sp. NPDC051861 TaxID=3155170 RepID=UPI0034468C75
MSAAPEPPPVPALITVNFHPDRLLADGRTVAACLAADGVYRTQFETGISNGGLNAAIGGARERWERQMFGPDHVGRPIYGALNLGGHPDGAAPRFGSCHLVLRPAVASRATFSHGDSHTEPSIVGTWPAFGAIWQALLDDVTRYGSALAVSSPAPDDWVSTISARTEAFAEWTSGPAPFAPGRAMDWYVEAQVHGGVTLRDDVTAVVADPSFRGTPTEAELASLGVPLRWHPGFTLAAGAVPAVLRAPELHDFARFVADRYQRPVLDAALVGRAARSVVRSSDVWARFGPPADVLQLVKYLWHVLVLFG